MIRLTEQQLQAVAASGATPPTLVDPNTQNNLRLDPQRSLRTTEGRGVRRQPVDRGGARALAWEAGKHAGWGGHDRVRRLPEKP